MDPHLLGQFLWEVGSQTQGLQAEGAQTQTKDTDTLQAEGMGRDQTKDIDKRRRQMAQTEDTNKELSQKMQSEDA